MKKRNIILATDSYKHSHFLQYPPDTEYVSAYIEARDNDFSPTVLFLGLQAFIKEYLLTPIDITQVHEANAFCRDHGVPFNEKGWESIVYDHGGYLPLKITALPEGTKVSSGIPLVQVENTAPGFGWLVTFIETALLRAVWYPSTVATLSRQCYDTIYAGLQISSDDPDGQVPFKLHDFGGRGASSSETAALGGMAHLVNFMGTDTMEGIIAAREYYGEPMAGFSIPASEHSTMTSWGKDGEVDAYRNMLKSFGGEGKLVACVSDSYDIYNAVNNIWGNQLAPEVEAMGGTLVVRPDSGDPVQTPLRCIELLAEKFGYTNNSKGFRVLNPCVRVIQGDGMDPETIKRLVNEMLTQNWSIDNIAFGMGGGLLQGVTRDTMRFAMKANAIRRRGQAWEAVSKSPKSDPSKSSKAGRQAVLVTNDGEYSCLPSANLDSQGHLVDQLEVIYKDGELVKELTFQDVRDNSKK